MNNFDLFQERLKASGTINKDTLIKNKINTFERALRSSFNTEFVEKDGQEFQALISRIDTMPKIERVSFATLLENECSVGDVILWKTFNYETNLTTETNWIIIEQLETESSIFQGYMDRALYEITWKDLDTGIVYTQQACAKGPDQTVITDGTKHAITFDTFTDSLYLLIPANTSGINLLKRYTELMVNGKKWIIEVIDDITKSGVIELQLKETSINRDTDTETLVNGKVNVDFTFTSALEDITEVEKDTIITLNPIIYKNNILENISYTIRVSNCTNNNGVITFNNTGTAVVQIVYASINKTYRYTINVVMDSVASVNFYDIIGDSTLKSMVQSTYTFINLVNGVSTPLDGDWVIDDETYVTIVSKNSNAITIKTLNKTGSFTLRYIHDALMVTKTIKVIPMFGGN